MIPPLFTPQSRADYERRKAEWGESGPSPFITEDRVVGAATDRETIVLNHRGFVPKDQTQQQKKRTFVDH